MKTLELLLISMRPHKWSRSIIVFLPLLFSHDPLNWVYWIKIFVAFLVFSLLTGANYILEDLINIELDKKDPIKKLMPIASGELTKNKAEFSLFVILLGSFVASFFLGTWIGVCAIIYFALKIINLLHFKNIPYLKFIISGIASLTVIVAGTIAIAKPLSNWLLFFIFSGSVFISLCSELKMLQIKRLNNVKGNIIYDEQLLWQTTTILATTTLILYCMFCLATTEGIDNNLIFSYPFVLFGTFRLLFLTNKVELNKPLEKLLLTDLQFLLNAAVWTVSVAILVNI